MAYQQTPTNLRSGIQVSMPNYLRPGDANPNALPGQTGGTSLRTSTIGQTNLNNATVADLTKLQRDEQSQYQAAQYGAQAEGLKSVVSGYEEILANADKYGSDINAIWKGIEDTLKQKEAQRVAAINAGYDPATIEEAYSAGIKEIQGAIEEISGIYQDTIAGIDELAATAPYSAQGRLSLMKEAIMQPTQEAANQVADLMQRTGGSGATMPVATNFLKTAFESMIPYVGQQVTEATTAREHLLGQKADMGKWYGSQNAGLRTNIANLQVGKGQALSDLSMRRGELLSDIYGDTSRGLMETGQGRAAGLTNAFQAKSSAIEGLSKARGSLTEASAMQKATKKYYPTDYSSLITQALQANKPGVASGGRTYGKLNIGEKLETKAPQPEASSIRSKTGTTYAQRQAERRKKWFD